MLRILIETHAYNIPKTGRDNIVIHLENVIVIYIRWETNLRYDID